METLAWILNSKWFKRWLRNNTMIEREAKTKGSKCAICGDKAWALFGAPWQKRHVAVCVFHYSVMDMKSMELLRIGNRDFAIVPSWCGGHYYSAEQVAELHGVERADCTVFAGDCKHLEDRDFVRLGV
jgi:hypothetical protein